MEKYIHIKYWETSFEELADTEQQLVIQARESSKIAYAPYSHFNVGAVALLDNEITIKGCNVENASYAVTLCAERNLLAHVQQYYPNAVILKIAITYYYENHNNMLTDPISPCGMCRQALLEFEMKQKQDISLILVGMSNKIIRVGNCKDLLPLSFTSEYL